MTPPGEPRYCLAAYCTLTRGHPGEHSPLHSRILGALQTYPSHAEPCTCHPEARMRG